MRLGGVGSASAEGVVCLESLDLTDLASELLLSSATSHAKLSGVSGDFLSSLKTLQWLLLPSHFVLITWNRLESLPSCSELPIDLMGLLTLLDLVCRSEGDD